MQLATGIAGTPMPAYLDVAALEELWAVAHSVRSLARSPSLEQASIERAEEPPGAGMPLVARGEYLVKSSQCYLCHVTFTFPEGAYLEDSWGIGGMRVGMDHWGTFYSRNITPDRETGIGTWTLEDMRRALREGRSKDGRRLNPADMPWTLTAALDDRDIEAIYAYLMSVPPVQNRVPPAEPPDLWEATGGKLAAIALRKPAGIGFFTGNAGSRADPESSQPAGRAAARFWALLAVFAAVAGGLASLRPHRRRRAAFASFAGLASVGAGAALLHAWPGFFVAPPDLLLAKPPFEAIARFFQLRVIRTPPSRRRSMSPICGRSPSEAATWRRSGCVPSATPPGPIPCGRSRPSPTSAAGCA